MKIKKIILIIGFVVLLIIGIYQIFLKEKNQEFNLTKVARGNISQEIFESGQVVRGERVNLSFRNPGVIEEIYVKVGDEIKAGQILAKLNTADIDVQLQGAQISLELTKLNLDKLLTGASPEEIKIAKTQIERAQIELEAIEKDLENNYEEALVLLNNFYSQLYNASEFIKEFARKYITIHDEVSERIMRSRNLTEVARNKAKEHLDLAKNSSKNEDIETALLIMEDSLKITFDNLEIIIRAIKESTIYDLKVSATDKSLLETTKTNINNVLINALNVRQKIFSIKLNLKAIEKNLKEAERRLDLITAPARQININLYKAQIRQAENQVRFYENQIRQSTIISPINGKIAEIKKEIGELAQPTPQDVIMIILPLVSYEIKVNIYEEDIIKINIDNPVEITLVAFPEKKFKGKITSISPVEKIIDGVVYYEIIISFEKTPENIKPTMTADIVIQTDLKENILIIPEEAIQIKNGKKIIEVYKNGLIKEREIKTGIQGTNNMIEIISGLEEGEEIIIQQ